MARKLTFRGSDALTINASDEDVEEAISTIVSSLKFEAGDNPLLTEITASTELLTVFQRRQKEIEGLLNTSLSKPTRSDLRLELRMLNQALKTPS